MYIDKNKTYSDAGKYLRLGNRLSYCFNTVTSDIQEVTDTLDNFVVTGSMITWCNGERAIGKIKDGTYEDYKTKMIKARYSNDDQIAIILNKDSGNDEDAIAYQRMQEWREYAAKVAREIIKIL